MNDLDTDDELIEVLDKFVSICYIMMIATTSLCNQEKIPNDLEEGGNSSIDTNVGLHDIFHDMCALPLCFKTHTNFTLTKFEELCFLVVPIVLGNARSTDIACVVSGRPPKLSLEQCVLHFKLYMKHDNANSYDSFHWD